MKKAFHYTPSENWERIKRDGLQLQLIKRDELSRYFPEGVNGIYLWEEDPIGMPHVANIIFQLYSKGCTKIVKIEIARYEILRYRGDRVFLNHKFEIGAFEYKNEETAVIAVNPIPASDIRFIREYDLIELLK